MSELSALNGYSVPELFSVAHKCAFNEDGTRGGDVTYGYVFADMLQQTETDPYSIICTHYGYPFYFNPFKIPRAGPETIHRMCRELHTIEPTVAKHLEDCKPGIEPSKWLQDWCALWCSWAIMEHWTSLTWVNENWPMKESETPLSDVYYMYVDSTIPLASIWNCSDNFVTERSDLWSFGYKELRPRPKLNARITGIGIDRVDWRVDVNRDEYPVRLANVTLLPSTSILKRMYPDNKPFAPRLAAASKPKYTPAKSKIRPNGARKR